ENETNNARLFAGHNASPYVKDGINDYVVAGRPEGVNPAREGTKAAVHYRVKVRPGGSVTTTLRLTTLSPDQIRTPFKDAEAVFAKRQAEANDFYRALTPASVSADGANVMRQALAGMLWSKQHYFMDLNRWLDEHGAGPFGDSSNSSRNREWSHMIND